MYRARPRPRPLLDRWPQHQRPHRPRLVLPPSRRVLLLHHRASPRVWRVPRPRTLLPRRLLRAYLTFRHR